MTHRTSSVELYAYFARLVASYPQGAHRYASVPHSLGKRLLGGSTNVSTFVKFLILGLGAVGS